VNLHNAVLFEGQGVDRLEGEMHQSARRVGPLDLPLW
jgi:hypothetical protein